MLAQILLFVLDTACGFFTLALLARFAMQATRVPFRNPLGQFVVAVTDWMVLPLRRVVPGLFGLDLASLLPAWLWQVANQGVALGFSGLLAAVSLAPTFVVVALAALETLKIGLYLVMGAVFIAALFSWVNPHAPLAGVFDALTRPLLRPLRRLIPPVGGVDLTPLALLLLLQVALFVLAGMRHSILPLMLVS